MTSQVLFYHKHLSTAGRTQSRGPPQVTSPHISKAQLGLMNTDTSHRLEQTRCPVAKAVERPRFKFGTSMK